MKQMSLGERGFKRKANGTRKREFLDEMILVAPRSELVSLIAPQAPQPGTKGAPQSAQGGRSGHAQHAVHSPVPGLQLALLRSLCAGHEPDAITLNCIRYLARALTPIRSATQIGVGVGTSNQSLSRLKVRNMPSIRTRGHLCTEIDPHRVK